MKTCVIFHDCDLDGWMSAAIVQLWWKKELRDIDNTTLNFIGYNYGQPIPDLSEYDKVIMCDISFPNNVMESLHHKLCEWYSDKFIWIDHHISAINDNGEFYDGLRNTKFAACELTWMYFMQGITKISNDMDAINNPMPEIVRLLGRYDCFGYKGTDEETKVLEFQYGARQCIGNYEEAYRQLILSFKDIELKKKGIFTFESKILELGKIIYEYLCTEAKQAYKNGFEILFNYPVVGSKVYGTDNTRIKFICINKERFNPINFGIDYHKDGYDGCACFHYANGMWNFSLYNDNGEVDCSQIAKQFGGGGHFSASGFRCDYNTFLKIIGHEKLGNE